MAPNDSKEDSDRVWERLDEHQRDIGASIRAQAVHEAVCGERYKEIKTGQADIRQSVTDMRELMDVLARRVFWALLAIAALVFAGPGKAFDFLIHHLPGGL